jgi:hypothetical protein
MGSRKTPRRLELESRRVKDAEHQPTEAHPRGDLMIVTLILLGIILPTQDWREILGLEARDES